MNLNQPGKIAARRLPPPFGVGRVRAAVLRAPEPGVHERAVLGLVERVAVVPHPLSLEDVALAGRRRPRARAP